YLFFIRPRRFGKSLFLSVMEAYYDVFYKDRFEEFFKGTWIYDHPTDERGRYLVLSLNFSVVEPDPEKMEASFLNHIQDAAVDFIQRYSDYLSTNPKRDYYAQKIENSRSATDVLSTLLLLCKGARQKLYVIIDEYDNFANTILSTVGEDAYLKLTHGPGFFRSFFNALKKGTTGTGAPISRSFITGVSPITMDDVTSGYNIGENVSLDALFNRMLGFTRTDVTEMIDYYQSAGLIKHETGYLMEIIDQWYGNYLFSEYSLNQERLYNSDMVLYFLKEYFKIQSIPGDLIDNNVRIDYDKLRHLIVVDRGKTIITNGNFSKLKEIVGKGETLSKITRGFPLEKLMDPENFESLLFYLGLLTIKGPEKNKLCLEIPNETVKRLYYSYIEEAYRETGIFALDLSVYSDLMTDMAYDGKWKPLLEFITGRMKESMSLRDLVTGEKSIQAFLNVYLGLSDLYIIHSEKELNKGYADLVMEAFLARYAGINYSYILEIKYLKSGSKRGDPGIQELIQTAEEQLKTYSIDEKYRKTIEKTNLIKLVLIFSGHKLVHIGEL
ncbi:MAG: AAA family ATPase, partial [Candidatus Aminicenantes bacterium]|nr:AAA family ATPase [Candidatus Aminicenantes bacterium]NIM78206.1 AAA family ATPase [Candidatus Aminicenantes bacterium]NIN23712.1 AAA family ATPase [Candidatus Aminicenantes bacterium]NIN47419.1 AAA family ATPase [Candidatus Aminicenantes bacterium]NIN90347.1 AAA family ATPase [Candidatus Aminicenantes bacterium]